MNMKSTVHATFMRIISVMAAVILTVSQVACSSSGSSSNTIVPGGSITPAKTVEKDITGDGENPTLTGILTERDTSALTMNFVDISDGTEYEVPYSGGTDIRDAYEKITAAVNMDIGRLYDVYINEMGKAVKIYGNTDAWVRYNVSGITVDESSRRISIGASDFVYETFSVVLSGDDTINIAQIVDKDVMTISGIDDKIYSINVTTSHGYLKITGTDAFNGGYVSIGSKQLYGITENMLVTAAEGTYSVNVRNGSLSSTKTVTITKGKTSTVDFSEVQTEATKVGAINFSVTPSGAIMSIDGSEVDYSSPVSLTYGTHTLTLVANYYEEYTETITVNSAYVTKVIDMTSTGSSTTTTTTTTSTESTDYTDGYSVSVTAPEGAALYVNSEYIGIVPCSFEKSSGKKTITLEKNGYNTVSYTISIANASGDLTYEFPDMVEETTTESAKKMLWLYAFSKAGIECLGDAGTNYL